MMGTKIEFPAKDTVPFSRIRHGSYALVMFGDDQCLCLKPDKDMISDPKGHVYIIQYIKAHWGTIPKLTYIRESTPCIPVNVDVEMKVSYVENVDEATYPAD